MMCFFGHVILPSRPQPTRLSQFVAANHRLWRTKLPSLSLLVQRLPQESWHRSTSSRLSCYWPPSPRTWVSSVLCTPCEVSISGLPKRYVPLNFRAYTYIDYVRRNVCTYLSIYIVYVNRVCSLGIFRSTDVLQSSGERHAERRLIACTLCSGPMITQVSLASSPVHVSSVDKSA